MRKPGPMKDANNDILSWNWKIIFYKHKVHAMTTFEGGGGLWWKNPPIRHLWTTWWWVGSYMPRPLHTDIHWKWGSMGPTVGLDPSEKKNLCSQRMQAYRPSFSVKMHGVSLMSSRRVQKEEVCSRGGEGGRETDSTVFRMTLRQTALVWSLQWKYALLSVGYELNSYIKYTVD